MDIGFGSVFIVFIITIGFVFVCLLIGKLFRPQNPTPMKEIPYECGERPIGQAWFNYNPRYYLIALIFVIFDVEIVFIFPVAVTFKSWVGGGDGMIAFFEITLFVVILFAALIYLWLKDDLKWIKELKRWR